MTEMLFNPTSINQSIICIGSKVVVNVKVCNLTYVFYL